MKKETKPLNPSKLKLEDVIKAANHAGAQVSVSLDPKLLSPAAKGIATVIEMQQTLMHGLNSQILDVHGANLLIGATIHVLRLTLEKLQQQPQPTKP